MQIELTWSALTDPGRRRARNEDAYLCSVPLFAVADGMGGHSRGEVASRMAVDGLMSIGTPDCPTSLSNWHSLLVDTIRTVDHQINEAGASAEAGMGTTLCGLLTCVDLSPPALLVFNVGDSRVYRYRDGHLTQMTRDHSLVQELIDLGRITTDEAATHPDRSVITRSLGSGDPLEVDVWAAELVPGDRWLACSDGLNKEVDDKTIAEILGASSRLDEATQNLVDVALDSGGRDNITVVVVEIGGELPTVDPHLDAVTNPRTAEGPTRPRDPNTPPDLPDLEEES